MSKTIKAEEKGFGEQIVTYLPILTLLSLGIGVVDLIIYYDRFHLDILPYLDITEIIFDTFKNTSLCVLAVLVIHFLTEVISFLRNRLLKITDPNDERRFVDISFNKLTIIICCLLTTSTTALIILLYYIERDYGKSLIYSDIRLLTFVVYGFIIISFLVNSYSHYIYAVTYFKHLKAKYLIFFNVILFLLIYNIYLQIWDVIRVKSLSSFGTYIDVNSRRIASDENYYYIGRTKNFTFFFNAKDDVAEAYQNKDITKISLNRKGIIKTLQLRIDDGQKQIDSIKRKLDSVKKKINISNKTIYKDNKKIDSLNKFNK